MKAMILAAGFGQRMRPLTLETPKPLLTVRGKTLIDYHIDALKKIGVTDIAINVHHLGAQIIDYFAQHPVNDVRLHFFQETEILGTGGGVYAALSLFADEPFILVSADIFTDYSYALLPQTINNLAHLVMVDNPSFHPEGDFYLNAQGLLSLQEGLPLTYANIGVFQPELFKSSVLGPKFEMRDVLRPAISAGQITAEHYTGLWENVGTIAQLEGLNYTG